MAIERAGVDQLPVIVELKHAMFAEAGLAALLANDFSKRVLEDYRLLYEGQEAAHFVALEGSEIIGMAGGFLKSDMPYRYYDNPRYGFIGDVYTRPHARRRGLARELSAFVLDWLASNGVAQVRLLSTPGARPLYASLGFVSTEEMALNLTAPRTLAAAEGPPGSADGEVQCFARYIISTIDHLVGSLGGLNSEELTWRPAAPNTNSLAAIVTHVLGNAEENILGILGGAAVERNRDVEFLAQEENASRLQQRWSALKARIHEALGRLPGNALSTSRPHPRRGSLTGREVLLVVARHAAEHWGEAQLTLSLLRARREN